MSLVASLVQTISSHTTDVNYVCFSGKTLATCSGDKTVRLWSTEDFTELPSSPLCSHTYYVNCGVFSPFGTILATCSTDGKIILWNSKSGEIITKLQHPSQAGLRVCQFSPDSSMLATGGDDETACLWDVATKKLIRSFEGHESMVPCVTFSPDSLYLITGCTAGVLFVWDARYGHGKKLAMVCDAHDLGVACCDFSPSFGSAGLIDATSASVHYLLATGGNDDAVKMWSFKATPGSPEVSLQLRDTLVGHTAHVMSCTFSNNGKYLASGSLDRTIRIWDPLKGECLHVVEGHSGYVTSCAFSPDSRFLASGSNDTKVMIWKITSEDQLTDEASYEDILVDVDPQLRKKHLEKWTVEDVTKWISELGLQQYEEVFRRNEIDGTELLTLTQDSLHKDLSIEALGHRNKILRAIEHVQAHPIIQSKEADSDKGIPDEYLCPITRETMKEPVLAADGYTYERAAITSWINNGKTRSPMTNSVLPNLNLMPNRSLKMLIQRYVQR